MAIVNRGFLIRSDRFSLKDRTEYRVYGYLRQRKDVVCEADGDPVPSEVVFLHDYVDERFGGRECMISVHLPAAGIRRMFRIYVTEEGKRNLAYEISAAELTEKAGPIQYYVDEFLVGEGGQNVRILGWAVAEEAVTVHVRAENGDEIPCSIERVPRLDVSTIYEETAVPEVCGFDIDIRGFSGNTVLLELSCGGDAVIRKLPVGTVPRLAAKGERLFRKGIRYMKYNGPEAIIGKAWDHLFHEEYRPMHYEEWIMKHLPGREELSRQRRKVFTEMPLISIVVPLYRTPPDFLEELLASIRAQTYENWECILSDGSGADSPLAGKLEEIERSDSRFRVIRHSERKHIAENTNAALSAAKGSFIAFADHDDTLVPSALFEVVQCINRNPEAELIYTDEDKILQDRYAEPNMKPDFDPDLLTSENYICHLLVVKKELADKTGPFDPDMNGAQDYDFILRCTEKTDRIYHIPKILYHWRGSEGSTAENPESKRYAFEAGRRAIEAHYQRMGWPASAEPGIIEGIYRTTYHWPDKPFVSVLIPNKDHTDDLRKAVSSLTDKTAWPDFEILVIENNSTDPATFAAYEVLEKEFPNLRVVRYEGGFNFSAINNFGAEQAKGEYLLLLNNDTEALSDIITEMMGFAMRPDVGAVGARLYYGDDTIQHAGAILGWGGVAGHAFVNQKREAEKYIRRIVCQQDYSCVTAACMMVRRDVFDITGGFSEDLAVAFNDIDLCMKIRKAGYLIVYDPFAELYHYESKSRGLENTPEKRKRFQNEVNTFRKRWGDVVDAGDPYYSPNLSMVTQNFSLRRI